MLKKFVYLSIINLILVQSSYAQQRIIQCPTVDQVKNITFDQKVWSAYGIDSGDPIDNNRLAAEVIDLNYEKLAEYMIDSPEGQAHCYYGNSNGAWAQFYLASSAPLLPYGNTWFYLSDYVWQCNLSKGACDWRMTNRK